MGRGDQPGAADTDAANDDEPGASMDPELSRIAADVLRPGEQVLWAGKPIDSNPLQFPWYFKVMLFGLLLFSAVIVAFSTNRTSAAFVFNLLPIVLIVGLLSLGLARFHSKYASPTYNTFLLTQHRAIHVFEHAQVCNVTSVPLVHGTLARLFRARSGTGDLLIRRKARWNEVDASTILFFLRRTAWAGVKFNSVPHAGYVRDVAKWAISQNEQSNPGHQSPRGR